VALNWHKLLVDRLTYSGSRLEKEEIVFKMDPLDTMSYPTDLWINTYDSKGVLVADSFFVFEETTTVIIPYYFDTYSYNGVLTVKTTCSRSNGGTVFVMSVDSTVKNAAGRDSLKISRWLDPYSDSLKLTSRIFYEYAGPDLTVQTEQHYSPDSGWLNYSRLVLSYPATAVSLLAQRIADQQRIVRCKYLALKGSAFRRSGGPGFDLRGRSILSNSARADQILIQSKKIVIDR
jgi:hypothetical protein